MSTEEKLKLSTHPKRLPDEYVAAATVGRFADEPGSRTPPPPVENPSPYQAQAPPSEDLLWGAQQIADFLGVSIDRVYYLIRTKRLPIGKLGRKTVVASRKKLQRALAETLAT